MSFAYPAHEGLQLVPDQGKEVVRAGGTGGVPIDPLHDSNKFGALPPSRFDLSPANKLEYDSSPEAVALEAPRPTQPQPEPEWEQGLHPVPPKPTPKRYCGLSRNRALIALIVVVLVVIGIVIGAVYGTLRARNSNTAGVDPAAQVPKENSTTSSSSPTPTSTPTPTTTSVTPPIPTSGILALNCPALNGTQYTSSSGSTKYTFQLFCQRDFQSQQSNIASFRVGSLDTCLENCAMRNNADTKPPCEALTFDANLTSFTKHNCFLKTAITSSTLYTKDAVQAGAVLLK